MCSALVHPLLESSAVKGGIATLSILVIVLLLRQVVVRSLRAAPLPLELRRRWILVVRNLSIAAFLVGAGVIWEAQLRTLALSFLAVAAAFVLATKELIACAVGATVRTGTGHVSLGDRIELKGIRGDVVDLGWLTTTLAEVGPGPAVHQSTGRLLVIPNSVFLTEPVANESFVDGYVFHSITIPLTADTDLQSAEARLLEATKRHTSAYAQEAAVAITKASEGLSIEGPHRDPRAWLRLVDADKRELIVRFVAPTRQRGRLEQAILRDFLETGTDESTSG